MFSALFEHGLEPTGAFANELADLGYVASRPEPSYPSHVWKRALEVACVDGGWFPTSFDGRGRAAARSATS